VSRIVVLDSGPLATVTHRGGVPAVDACKRWLTGLLRRGVRVIVPEIADYETRRELLRAGKANGVARLDALEDTLEYLPLTTAAMRRAAQLWAEIRRQGQPTADDKALDGDVILAAQALTVGAPEGGVVVATTNVGHLARLVSADLWQQIH
jgi:predicted nucleic acid-binding protein